VAALEDIASRAGGRFFFAGDEAGLDDVYARIDEMSPRKIETISFRPRQSLGVFPLAVATLIALLGATGFHLRSVIRASA
jgi:Ca-activated chloride channel family protein